MALIPSVIEKSKNWERVYDIYSRLLEDRIIFIWEPVTDHLVNSVQYQDNQIFRSKFTQVNKSHQLFTHQTIWRLKYSS